MTNVNINDLELILTGAKAIQDAEILKREIEKIDFSDSKDLQEAVYELAELSHVSRENVDRFLETFYPSAERRLITLKEIDGKVDEDTAYEYHKEILLNEMKKKFPSEIWEWQSIDSTCTGLYQMREEKGKELIKNGLFKKEERDIIKQITIDRIAEIYYSSRRSIFSLLIRKPFFAEACKDKLIELKKRFNGSFEGYEIITKYL